MSPDEKEMPELPKPKPFTWDREAQLVDDLWKMRVEKDKWKYLAFQAFAVVVILLILCGIWLVVIWNCANKEVSVNFEPEMIRYTNSPIYTNHIQGAHSIFPMDLVEHNLDDIGLNVGRLYGHSMQPTFYEGNTAVLKRVWKDPKYNIKTGEIVRFFRTDENKTCPEIYYDNFESMLGGSWINNSMAVVHRVSAYYDDDSIIVQGDNLYEQESIARCQITDVVVGILFT